MQPVKISPWLFWVAVPLSLIPLSRSGPGTYEQLLADRAIEQYGGVAQGRVVRHEQASGGGNPGCRSRVTVFYEVAGKPYRLTERVCGTNPDALAAGRSVDVRYMTGSPEMAAMRLPQAGVRRASWSDLALQLAIPVSLGLLGWAAWRHQRRAP